MPLDFWVAVDAVNHYSVQSLDEIIQPASARSDNDSLLW